jgi:magnesium-transporting ATPase (P-type)
MLARLFKKNQSYQNHLLSDKNSPHWHALDYQEAFKHFNTDQNGLAADKANESFKRYGYNRLPEAKKRNPLVRFLSHFHNLFIYVLLISGIVTAMLGHWIDSGVIMAVVIVNALIGFIQEGKAEDALKAISRMLSHHAMVMRNGQRHSIPSENLVPGDIVLIQSGDKVPADLRLFSVKSLQIQEAILTGESVAVEKQVKSVAEDAQLGDRSCMAYSGTMVTYGQGSGVVVETGPGTQLGRISAMLANVEKLTTPLLRQMSQFASWLTGFIIVFALLAFIFGVQIRGYLPSEMFLAAVGLAVAAIPEGLPAIMTITLAIGVQRMAHRNSIIRRLPAVETLGSVSVICSDKTGTLTKNEMTVKSVITTLGGFEVSGVGYNPHGGFVLNDKDIDPGEDPILSELTRACLLCNDASLYEENHEWIMHGDPTEGALLSLGLKAGLQLNFVQEMWPRDDVIPFESEHRFMATLHHDHTGKGFAYIKGAPERILEMCDGQKSPHGEIEIDRVFWQSETLAMAEKGQRVLAIAYKPVESESRELTFADLEQGLILLGLVGMIDPPREEAIRAVHSCQTAGVQVKMITGDHAVTAVAIADEMNIGDGVHSLTGQDIEAMDDAALEKSVNDIDVYARSSPEHKLRLVKAMQANGHVVAMTGDGVNDAPALKRANVGVAMGQNGTEVAKEAAEMVLVDDNFASIAYAVEEGRTVYDNLKKAILFILPTNGGEAFTIVAAIMLGRVLPITPVQILWVNMITAVTLALALAFEPPEKNLMNRPPRNTHEPILTGLFIWRIIFVSLILVAGTFGLFIWERENGASIEYARTVAVNTLVMFEIFYLFNSRYIIDNVLNFEGLFGNRYVLYAAGLLIIFQLSFTYLSPMQTLFGTTALDLLTWIQIIFVASSVLFLVEIEKHFMRRWQH